MIYLRIFNTNDDYDSFKNGEEWITPNVSVIADTLDVKYHKHAKNYLTFKAIEDSTIALSAKTSPNVLYSIDYGEWVEWDYSAITLSAGSSVRMKGSNPNGFTIDTKDSNRNKFVMTGKISASGNIMSLLYDDDFENNTTIPCSCCYSNMFAGCTSLTTAPELPATTLAEDCYSDMFYGCTSLTTAPELPATTLAKGCYLLMFKGCTSLTTAPELPATTLVDYCYSNMFQDCTSLTTAPELPATTLVDYCYKGMFYGCSKLNYIKMLATDISASNCLNSWVSGVASTGTFVKSASMISLPTGVDGIPSGWTIENV